MRPFRDSVKVWPATANHERASRAGKRSSIVIDDFSARPGNIAVNGKTLGAAYDFRANFNRAEIIRFQIDGRDRFRLLYFGEDRKAEHRIEDDRVSAGMRAITDTLVREKSWYRREDANLVGSDFARFHIQSRE